MKENIIPKLKSLKDLDVIILISGQFIKEILRIMFFQEKGIILMTIMNDPASLKMEKLMEKVLFS